MIDITSIDARTTLKISPNVEDRTRIIGPGRIMGWCSLSHAGRSLSLETSFERQDLADFAHSLAAMHRNLATGAASTLWSFHGNVAIGLHMETRGTVTMKCLFSEDKNLPTRALFASTRLDQTYLPLLGEQAMLLSDASNLFGE